MTDKTKTTVGALYSPARPTLEAAKEEVADLQAKVQFLVDMIHEEVIGGHRQDWPVCWPRGGTPHVVFPDGDTWYATGHEPPEPQENTP